MDVHGKVLVLALAAAGALAVVDLLVGAIRDVRRRDRRAERDSLRGEDHGPRQP